MVGDYTVFVNLYIVIEYWHVDAQSHCFPARAIVQPLFERSDLDEFVTAYGCLIRTRLMQAQDLRCGAPIDVRVCYASVNLASMLRVDSCCTLRELKITVEPGKAGHPLIPAEHGTDRSNR